MPRLSSPRIAIPAIIVALVAAAGGAQLWSQHQAEANFNQMLANLPPGSSGHYKGLSYNLFTRTLRIKDLTITRGGQPSISIGGAVVHHLSGNGETSAPFHADAVRLENVVLQRGAHRLTVAVVQAQNLAVLAPDVAPPPNTPRWLIAPGSGTLIGASTITAQGIADDQGATLAAISVTAYHDGQLQQASASRFADRDGNEIATAEAQNLDLGGLDRVFDTGRYTPGAATWTVPRILIGQATVNGLQSHNATGGATVETISLSGFAARPFATAPNTAAVKTPAFARDAAEAVAVGSFGLTGLHFHDTGTKTVGTLGAFTLTGYADGALAHAAFDNLLMTGNDPSNLRIGHFGITGLTATKLLHDPGEVSTATAMAAAESGAMRIAGITLAKFSVTPAGDAPVSLDLLSDKVTGSDPIQSDLTLRGLRIPPKSNADLASGLGLLGIDALVLDLDENGSYAPRSGAVVVRQMALTARGLGQLSFTGSFTNFPPDALMTMGSGLGALAGVGIGPFTFRFTNDTLLQRILALNARRSGKTVAEVTDEAKLAASFMAAGLVPGQADAGAQIAAFLDNPKALTITATPTDPVPFGALTDSRVQAARDALNLRLTAN